jgi:hypothetical protein
MDLAVIKQKLQTVTGTEIKDVVFDWQVFLNETRDKKYPTVLWMLDGASFSTDMRSSTIQKSKTFNIIVYAIAPYDPNSEDKITVWDDLEKKFKAYLNVVDSNISFSIENINNIKGKYIGDGGNISADTEIGIRFENVSLKVFC